MPTVFVRRGGFTFCCLLAGLRFLTGPTAPPAFGAQYEACKFFSELPDDCAGAELRKFDNLRNYRYEEIDLFARDPLKKVLYVSTYNTTGQNGGEDSRDSAPKAIAQSVDSKRVAKQFQALSAAISPPRYWTLDWLSDRVGEVRNFGGLDAAWMGNSLAPRLPQPASRAPWPIAACWWRERRSKASRKDRRSIFSTIPRAEPGSWSPTPTKTVPA